MAVYTQVESNDIEALLKRFQLGGLRSFRGIAEGVENSNFLIESDQARYILTLYEKRVDPADLPFFLGLMDHLNAAGIACPLPLRDASGAQLFTLKQRPAALISYLDGVSIDSPSAQHCTQLGGALADLHCAQAGFNGRRKNALSLEGWASLVDKTSAAADTVTPGLSGILARERGALEAFWPASGALPEGVIHADLFPDNVFFLKGKLSGIIDFYFACNDALAYDVAICLNAWCFDKTHRFLSDRADALLQGYQAVRALTSAEQAALPMLCRGAAFRFLLTRLYDWLNPAPGALVKPKDPRDYVARLQHFQSASERTL
ncbi:MAG: homoserine kinase [Pseudomonadota bacterium]